MTEVAEALDADAVRLRTPTSIFRWILFVSGPVLFAVTAVMNTTSGTVRNAALTVVAAVAAALLGRIALMQTIVTADGARVRNPFRTADIRWDDVAAAQWIARPLLGVPALRSWGLDARVRLRLRNGRFVTLTSTYAFRADTAAEITTALRQAATPAGVTVDPLHPEGPPPTHHMA